MGAILVPGFLTWDGQKYVLQEIDVPRGPAGTPGPAGPAGPAGTTLDFITTRFVFLSAHIISISSGVVLPPPPFDK